MICAMTDPENQPVAEMANLLRLLDVSQQGEDCFQGPRKPGGVGRVFGGQVIGQALASAERTVAPDRAVHSLHAYFLRGGSEEHEIDFRVERDLDGGSFSNRRVIASQRGTPILNLVASFHRREDGFHHQDTMPDVPQPEALQSEAELRKGFVHLVPDHMLAQVMAPRLIEMRPVNPAHWMAITQSEPAADLWFRAASPLPDDPRVHRAVLAYASDLTLLGTSALPHPLSWIKGEIAGASLDHALWFHDDFRADDWLLYSMDSPWAGHARGFNRGRIFTRDGRLVASVAQEGLIRAARK